MSKALTPVIKYVSMDRELPPIGKIVITMNGNGDISLRRYYIHTNGEIHHYELTSMILTNKNGCGEDKTKWAFLPPFIPIAERFPPVGEAILTKIVCKDENLPPRYVQTVLTQEEADNGMPYDVLWDLNRLIYLCESWLPVSALKDGE